VLRSRMSSFGVLSCFNAIFKSELNMWIQSEEETYPVNAKVKCTVGNNQVGWIWGTNVFICRELDKMFRIWWILAIWNTDSTWT
jgi:hypothetical protein